MVVLGLEMTAAVMVNANRDQYRKTVDKELLTMIQKEYAQYPQKAAIVDEIQSSVSVRCICLLSFFPDIIENQT